MFKSDKDGFITIEKRGKKKSKVVTKKLDEQPKDVVSKIPQFCYKVTKTVVPKCFLCGKCINTNSMGKVAIRESIISPKCANCIDNVFTGSYCRSCDFMTEASKEDISGACIKCGNVECYPIIRCHDCDKLVIWLDDRYLPVVDNKLCNGPEFCDGECAPYHCC